jgi:hypothetical protein
VIGGLVKLSAQVAQVNKGPIQTQARACDASRPLGRPSDSPSPAVPRQTRPPSRSQTKRRGRGRHTAGALLAGR